MKKVLLLLLIIFIYFLYTDNFIGGQLSNTDKDALKKQKKEKEDREKAYTEETKKNTLEKKISNTEYIHETQYENEKNKNKVQELNKNSSALINYLEANKKIYEEYAEIIKKQDNFAIKYIKKIISIL